MTAKNGDRVFEKPVHFQKQYKLVGKWTRPQDIIQEGFCLLLLYLHHFETAVRGRLDSSQTVPTKRLASAIT